MYIYRFHSILDVRWNISEWQKERQRNIFRKPEYTKKQHIRFKRDSISINSCILEPFSLDLHPRRPSKKKTGQIERYCAFDNAFRLHVCAAAQFQFKRTFRLNSHLIVMRKTIESNWFKILLGVVFAYSDRTIGKQTKSNRINDNIDWNIGGVTPSKSGQLLKKYDFVLTKKKPNTKYGRRFFCLQNESMMENVMEQAWMGIKLSTTFYKCTNMRQRNNGQRKCVFNDWIPLTVWKRMCHVTSSLFFPRRTILNGDATWWKSTE